MRRLPLFLLALCVFLTACGGAGRDNLTGGEQPGTAVAAVPVATATVAPTPTVRPTATATPKLPAPAPTRPRATTTRTAAPVVQPTATVPPPAVAKVATEPGGRCRVGLPAGFVVTEEPSATWYTTDRLIAATVVAPESAEPRSLTAATQSALGTLQGQVAEFRQSSEENGAGARRIDFTGTVGGKRAWGTLFVRQFGLDYCQLTVIATAGTTTLLDPLVETMVGSLGAINPRPAPVAYLALGDSFVAGVGATDPKVGSYPARFTAAINDAGGAPIGVSNLGIPGATSAAFLGDWATTGKAGTSPLAAAVRALEGGTITIVTIEIGGNDILRLLKPGQPCAGSAIESEPCLAAMRESLATMTAPNLPLILGALVEAAPPGTQILLVNYPNAFSTGSGSLAERRTDLAIGDLNGMIAMAMNGLSARATARGVTLTPVDLAPLFAGKGGTLTHILDPTPDIHPTDAGYAVIVEALLRAYRR